MSPGSLWRCGTSWDFTASARNASDSSIVRTRPRKTPLIQSQGSVPRAVIPNPEYPRIAVSSFESTNVILRESSFGGWPTNDTRRSAASQIDSVLVIARTRVKARHHQMSLAPKPQQPTNGALHRRGTFATLSYGSATCYACVCSTDAKRTPILEDGPPTESRCQITVSANIRRQSSTWATISTVCQRRNTR